MKYLDKEHHLLRIVAKVKAQDQVGVAHLPWMKPVGADYAALRDIERRRNLGENISEVIPWTDAEFDQDKLKNLLVERLTFTEEEFDAALASCRAKGLIHAARFEGTVAGTRFFVAAEALQVAEDKTAKDQKREPSRVDLTALMTP